MNLYEYSYEVIIPATFLILLPVFIVLAFNVFINVRRIYNRAQSYKSDENINFLREESIASSQRDDGAYYTKLSLDEILANKTSKIKADHQPSNAYLNQ